MQTYFQKKLLIISGIFLIVSFVLFFFLYYKVKSNTEISEQASRDWQMEAYKREKLASLGSLVKKIGAEKAQIESHFVQSSDVVYFLDAIDDLASKALVDKAVVSTIDILADKSALVMEVRATGSFDSLYKFLVLLENSHYELSFSSVDFRREGDLESDSVKAVPLWNATFKIKLISFMQ